MPDGLVIAAAEHGPGMHGPVLLGAIAVAVVGGLIYGLVRLVAKSRAARMRLDRGPENDRGPEA